MTARRAQVAAGLLGLAVILALVRAGLPAGLVRPPEWMVLPFADWINAVFAVLHDDLGLMTLTRAFSDVVEACLDVTANLL